MAVLLWRRLSGPCSFWKGFNVTSGVAAYKPSSHCEVPANNNQDSYTRGRNGREENSRKGLSLNMCCLLNHSAVWQLDFENCRLGFPKTMRCRCAPTEVLVTQGDLMYFLFIC